MRKILHIILFIVLVQSSAAQTVTISGFVFDNSSGETLTGANIYDINASRGAFTNSKGFFSLTIEHGRSTLKATYIGYEPANLIIDSKHDTTIIVKLIAGIKLDEVLVQSFRQESDFLKGRLSLPMNKLKELPALGGETDLIKAFVTLPGITPVNEGTSGMIVRGGSSDQNLFILDGMPVYNTGHLFDFISIFNPEVIKRVDFYKGSFPSKYGGRLSSVTDITFRDGNNNHRTGTFDAGLINSKVSLEGPLNTKTTFLIAARSTYFDLFTPIRRALINNKKKFKSYGEIINDEMILYTFADLNLKVNHRFNNKHNLSFLLYSGSDYYRIFNNYELQNEKNKYTLLNNLISIKSSHVINPRLFVNSMFGFSSNSGQSKYENVLYHQYSFIDTIAKNFSKVKAFEMEEQSEQKSSITDMSSTIDFTYYLGNSNTFNFGISGTEHFFQPGIYKTRIKDTINNIVPFESNFRNKEYTSGEVSIYCEDVINIKNKINIIGGIRYNVLYGSDKIFRNIEPRLSVSVPINKSGAFILSYSRMTQSVHALLKNDLLMYKTLWVPSFSWLPPEKSDLFSVGYSLKNINKNYSLALESFYKSMYDLIEYRVSYNSKYSYYNWENSVIPDGQGRSYGFEFSYERKLAFFTGNINYTLSWYERKFEELNGNHWYPFNFDRRHVLNFLGVLKISDTWSTSFLWTLSSGHRINFPTAYVNTNPYAYGYFIYSGLNSQRLPLYHRLDISAEWHKRRSNGKLMGLKFSLYNAYYRKNAYYLFVDKSNQYDEMGNIINSSSSVKKKSLLPIIPSINFFYNF